MIKDKVIIEEMIKDKILIIHNKEEIIHKEIMDNNKHNIKIEIDIDLKKLFI